MDWRVRIPGGLYRRAVDRATADGTTLDLMVRHWLERYVDPPPSAQSLGGHAAAARLTPEQRTARARASALARWSKRQP